MQENENLIIPQLAYEARKSKKIIASRDISYAFTNVMANHYYSLRMCSRQLWRHSKFILCAGSYEHFCFFDHISNSTKKKDDFAFFIFFTFKSESSKYFFEYFLIDVRLEASVAI
jgi:hypothetical protein